MPLEDALHASLSLYMRAPHWARATGGRLYRLLPERVRFGSHHARFAAEAAHHLHSAPWPMVEARIDDTLRAAAAVPAFAAHAVRLLDASVPPLQRLRALAPCSKLDIKHDLAARLSPRLAARERLPMFTGGSTEHPMQFCLQRGVSRPKESAYIARIEQRLLGASSDGWTLSLRGRTVGSAARDGGRLWTTEPIKRHLIFSSDHLEPRYMPAYVDALRRHRPRQIHAFPSALYPLAVWLRRHPCPEFSERVTGILLTSESVHSYQMALLREVFPRARIVPHYGHSERVLMATASTTRGEYSFMPLYGFVELLDARGHPIEREGELGEIVGTSFDNHVMPFVRYRTGDLGAWARVPRHAGEVRFVMQRIEGRAQEFVVCADHRLVSVTTLGAAHFHELSRVEAIQFEQHAPGRLDLKVVCHAPLSSEDRARIAGAVRDKTQGGCTVDVYEVAAIERTPRGKQRMLIQHLELGGYLGAGGPGAQHATGRGVAAAERVAA